MGTGAAFMIANPEILKKSLLFAACSAVGQSFIFFVVSEYGPLKNATVTTTRKIFSVLLSVFTKGHALSPLGWAGIVLGSLGIVGELTEKKEDKKVSAKDTNGKKNGDKNDKENSAKKPETKKDS